VVVVPEFKEAKIFNGHQKTARALAVSADGRQLLSVGDDKAVLLWSPASDKPTRCDDTRSEGVGAAFLPGGREAIVADGGQGYLIDLIDNEVKRDFKPRAGGIVAIAVCADGQHFLSAMQTAQLLWWDVGKDEPERTIELGTNAPVNCMAMTKDGKLALVGNRNDGMVGVWDVATGKLIKKWKAHGQDVVAAAFSPDGKRVATMGQDKLGKVWDPMSGKELLTLKGHTDVPIAVAYSADGALIFSTGIDRSIRTWDAGSGAAQPLLSQTGEKVFSLAVDPKNRFLIVGLSGGAVQMIFLPVRPANLPKADSVEPP
jgi:WD40 repeat protein